MSALLGALALFVAGSLLGGALGALLWLISFSAVASLLLSPRRSKAEPSPAPSRRPWAGPISLDEQLVREEILALGLDAATGEALVAAAGTLSRERGVDPRAAASAIVEAILGDPRDLELLGWPLRPGLSKEERIREIQGRR